MLTDAERLAVVAESKSWMGTPYHHMAMVKGVGVDCLMLLIGVYRAIGKMQDVDPRPYPVDWHLHRNDERYLAGLASHCKQVAAPGLGDVVMFRYGRTASHAGIYIGDDRIIHAWQNQRAVVETHLGVTDYLKTRIHGYFQLS